MYGYIYLTTNILNNKKYIGQHKSSCFKADHYLGSGIYLTRAIKKYGSENFKVQLLKECYSQQDLDASEKYFIELYDAANSSQFYNIANGARGGNIHTPEMIQKLRDARSHQPSYTAGKIKINNGTVEKLIMPEDLLTYQNNGWSVGRVGPTTKNRIYVNNGQCVRAIKPQELDSYIKTGWKRGNLGNSAPTGKITVHKNEITKLIYPTELNSYLADGWSRGRTPRNYVWINNGKVAKRVPQSELTAYEGWVCGMLRNSK